MNASVAINLFAKAMVREQRIPFEIAADLFWSEADQAALSRSIAQCGSQYGSA
jgi:DNA-damage-inducible protein J